MCYWLLLTVLLLQGVPVCWLLLTVAVVAGCPVEDGNGG